MRNGKKRIALPALLLFAASLAAAQTVAEAAQKEKERREALKPGTAVVVTNLDLSKVKKKSSVKLPGEAAPAAGGTDVQGQPGTVVADTLQAAAAAVSTGQGADPRTAQIPSSQLEGNPKAVYEQHRADLERIWAAAKERIDLLKIKMLGLQQQANAAVLPGARDEAQAALVETSKTLQEAQAAERKAREDLDRFISGGKSGV